MGTSTHNSGQKGKTPLVPSWLQDTEPSVGTLPDNVDVTAQIGNQNRFTAPRGEFTRYINSGGYSSGMARKSISNYVKNSMGGSRNATQRLGSARNSTAKLLNIASAFASGGAHAVEQYLSISNLAHKSAAEAFISIANFVCPDGGPQDEGIARSAYISALCDYPELAEIPFDALNNDQMMLLVEKSMVNVVYDRIKNDIGNKIIYLPENPAISDDLVQQIKDFIKGGITDAIARLGIRANNLSQSDSLAIVDSIYETAFDIMVAAGDAE